MKNFFELETLVNERIDNEQARTAAINYIREYLYTLPENYSDLIMEAVDASIEASTITALNILREYHKWANS